MKKIKVFWIDCARKWGILEDTAEYGWIKWREVTRVLCDKKYY